jgi:3-methyl-2-oxobutanoate hydroxymethyltransferase
MNIHNFQKCKSKQKITWLTCYDYPSACIINHTNIDCILIGDSVAMAVHGFADTTHATVDMITLHTQAVRRGTNKFIVADMPFMSYRKSLDDTLTHVQRLVQAGANAVKLEGTHGSLDTITHIVHSGVPVVGHIGLTPQHVNTLGGYRVQGKTERAKAELLEQALQLQEAGCFMLVLELVPADIAEAITKQLTIPTIGIGAGPYTDGQVLVWHDMLGMQQNLDFKFLKKYLNGFEQCKQAIDDYDRDVKLQAFPDIQLHCY